MALGPKLTLKQRQQLALTPGLRQSIELMMISAADLAELVDRRLEENPFLERLDRPSGSEDWSGSADAVGRLAAPAPSLQDYLAQEARVALDDPADLAVALELIADLDESGYLPPDVLGGDAQGDDTTEEQRREAVLAVLQTFGPPGLFARSLAECLALQLRDRGVWDSTWQRLLDTLPLLAKGETQRLARETGLSPTALSDRLAILRGLDPKPGLSFQPPESTPAIADLIVTLDRAGRPEVKLNPDTAPRLSVDRARRRALAHGLRRPDERRYAAERLAEAGWLVRALERRGESLLALGRALVQHQTAFFREGFAALRPLTRRTLAERLSLSEASVSRLVANKHIETPWGLLPLSRLFSAQLTGDTSAAQVSARLALLIREEPAEAPLSDDALASTLAEEGFAVARRTVAKYRNKLSIPPAHLRRRLRRAAGSTVQRRQLDSPRGRH